jgi:adenylate cyclase
MRIELFGAPAIRIGEDRYEHRSRKAMALLAYLAMRADEHLPRSHLAALLWGDSGEEQARANLRQTLSQLRKLFKQAGHDPIMVPFDKVVLATDDVTIDARSVLNGGISVEPRVLAGWPEFLEGFSVGAPEFDRWMAAQRSAIRSRLIEGLEKAASDAARENKHAAASENLSIALKLDPLHEALHRRLMESLAAQGKSDEALAQYNACRNLLGHELQIEPDAETRELAGRIRANRRKAATEQTKSFRRYPSANPVLVFALSQEQYGPGFGVPDRYENAEIALRGALNAMRREQGSETTGFGVVNDTGDAERDRNSARELLAACRGGEIIVDPAIYEQFENWSPFAFERMPTDQGEEAGYRLLSEMPPDRFQVVPNVESPEVTPTTEFSVAVMPFQDRSPYASDYALGDIMAEEITHKLSRFRRLTVASPSACQSFCAKGYSVEDAHKKLGVNYLVDGSIYRSGDHLRVNLALTDLRTNKLIFSDHFDGEFEQIFEHQDNLTDRISNRVFQQSENTEILRAERLPTSQLGAYEWFLRGMAMHRRGRILPEFAPTAFDYFSKAIEMDPEYVQAIAWRICAVSRFAPEYFENPGLAEIHYALTINENDPEVQRIAGSLHIYRGDYEDSVRHIERAAALNPNDAYMHAIAAAHLTFAGMPDKGLTYVERALALDPFIPVWCIESHGIVLYSLGAFPEAIAAIERLWFPTPRALAFQAASQAAIGCINDAKNTIEKIQKKKNVELCKLLNHAGLN